MSDYYFATKPSDSIDLDVVEESDEIKSLPNLQNSGTVKSLRQAMMRDVQLKELVQQYVQTQDYEQRKNILDTVVLKWAKTEQLNKNEAGEHVDYRKLE